MVLVNTSVWVRFLANREPFASGLDRLLGDHDGFGHELVSGELLAGAVGDGRAALLRDYPLLRWARTIPHSEVVAFVRARGLSGRGVGWIDMHLLASTLTAGLRLWTADTRLGTVATELGVAWVPTRH